MAAPLRHLVLDTEAVSALLDIAPQHVSAAANLHVKDDDPLDGNAANRNVQLRQAVPTASLVDASVIVSAERLRGGDVVEVLPRPRPSVQARLARPDRRC